MRADDSRKAEVMQDVLDPLAQRVALQEARLICEEEDRRHIIRTILQKCTDQTAERDERVDARWQRPMTYSLMQLRCNAIRNTFLCFYHGLLVPLERQHAERSIIASYLETRILGPLVRGEYAHIVYDTRHVDHPNEHHDDDRFTDVASDDESTSSDGSGRVLHWQSTKKDAEEGQLSEREQLEAKTMLLEDKEALALHLRLLRIC